MNNFSNSSISDLGILSPVSSKYSNAFCSFSFKTGKFFFFPRIFSSLRFFNSSIVNIFKSTISCARASPIPCICVKTLLFLIFIFSCAYFSAPSGYFSLNEFNCSTLFVLINSSNLEIIDFPIPGMSLICDEFIIGLSYFSIPSNAFL